MSFSESPLHLLTTVDALTLKKVVLPSVATALARRVLPVPGGPKRRTERQGVRRDPERKAQKLVITLASILVTSFMDNVNDSYFSLGFR